MVQGFFVMNCRGRLLQSIYNAAEIKRERQTFISIDIYYDTITEYFIWMKTFFFDIIRQIKADTMYLDPRSTNLPSSSLSHGSQRKNTFVNIFVKYISMYDNVRFPQKMHEELFPDTSLTIIQHWIW